MVVTRNTGKRKDSWVQVSPHINQKKGKTQYGLKNLGPFKGLSTVMIEEEEIVVDIYDVCSPLRLVNHKVWNYLVGFPVIFTFFFAIFVVSIS